MTENDNDSNNTEQLWEAFKAGFDVSAEGFNAEYGAKDSEIRQLFDEWLCSHEFLDWEYVTDSVDGKNTCYRRECRKCGYEEYTWEEDGEDKEGRNTSNHV